MTRDQCLTAEGLGKRYWTNKKAAKRAAKQFNSNSSTRRHRVEVYRCGGCGYWHHGRALTRNERRARGS